MLSFSGLEAEKIKPGREEIRSKFFLKSTNRNLPIPCST